RGASPGNTAWNPALEMAARSFSRSNCGGMSTVAVLALASTVAFFTPSTDLSALTIGGAHAAQSMPTTLKVKISASNVINTIGFIRSSSMHGTGGAGAPGSNEEHGEGGEAVARAARRGGVDRRWRSRRIQERSVDDRCRHGQQRQRRGGRGGQRGRRRLVA